MACEAAAIVTYTQSAGAGTVDDWEPAVMRWACLRLPNGQVACSSWKEILKPMKQGEMGKEYQGMGLATTWILPIYYVDNYWG